MRTCATPYPTHPTHPAPPTPPHTDTDRLSRAPLADTAHPRDPAFLTLRTLALRPTTLPPPPPDTAHLRDPAFLRRALRLRTARLLHTVAARLRKHARRSGDFFAWNKCLLHLLVGAPGGVAG